MNEELSRKIKADNDALLKERGYKVNDWLPFIERLDMKNLEEIKGRMAVMNALINISFEAPVAIIRAWIEKHNLNQYLSGWEKEILAKKDNELSAYEINSLRWYLEGLWALMWCTKMIDNLDENEWCGDYMADLLPRLEQDEDNSKIESISQLRDEKTIFRMLDYYFRLHWYCVDARLTKQKPKIDEGVVYERRKAMEWLMDNECDWDDADGKMNT